jgi:hypothetical protein
MASIYEMMMGANKSFQDGRAQGQQQHLGQLYSQALTAPQGERTPILAQMAQVSPDAAVGAQRSLADGDETAIKSTMQALSMATAAWKAGNKDMAQGFYTQAAPHLASLAGGRQLPPQMDDSAAQAFDKILASVARQPAAAFAPRHRQRAGRSDRQGAVSGRSPAAQCAARTRKCLTGRAARC